MNITKMHINDEYARILMDAANAQGKSMTKYMKEILVEKAKEIEERKKKRKETI